MFVALTTQSKRRPSSGAISAIVLGDIERRVDDFGGTRQRLFGALRRGRDAPKRGDVERPLGAMIGSNVENDAVDDTAMRGCDDKRKPEFVANDGWRETMSQEFDDVFGGA